MLPTAIDSSVGQQAFVGLRGYLLFALTLLGGINPSFGIPLAGPVSALVALPTAVIVFRLRGAYLRSGSASTSRSPHAAPARR
jgi:branched-chain amino acid transport system permease protein